jgi:hypothetical protein
VGFWFEGSTEEAGSAELILFSKGCTNKKPNRAESVGFCFEGSTEELGISGANPVLVLKR